MASKIVRFPGYFSFFRPNNLTFCCLQRYKLGTQLSRVRAAKCSNEAPQAKSINERLQEIARSPSGWVPPQDPRPSLPFEIRRSKTNNLPVYVDKKRGGSLVLTIIKNIKGDMHELVRILKQHLGDNVHFQINEITSQIKIKGYHKDAVVTLLKEQGF